MYTILGSAAAEVAVQSGTDEDISEGLGVDVGDGDDNAVRLVLNDLGNLHALILHGTPQDFQLLADRMYAEARLLPRRRVPRWRIRKDRSDAEFPWYVSRNDCECDAHEYGSFGSWKAAMGAIPDFEREEATNPDFHHIKTGG